MSKEKTPLATLLVVSAVALMLLIGAIVMLRSIDNLDEAPSASPATLFSR